jgi:hypothetical protein
LLLFLTQCVGFHYQFLGEADVDAYSASLLFIAEVEKVVGWARNHYLSSTVSPSIKGDKLIIPQER